MICADCRGSRRGEGTCISESGSEVAVYPPCPHLEPRHTRDVDDALLHVADGVQLHRAAALIEVNLHLPQEGQAQDAADAAAEL